MDMAELASLRQEDSRKRRRDLKKRRLLKSMQSLWRFLALMSLAGGAVWLISRPEWILYNSQQIIIEGNQALSKETIRSLIPLSYPQSLLSLQPKNLEIQIETQGPIAEANITRHLLPPSLKIEVQERLPVARSLTPVSGQHRERSLEAGFLDEQGNWLPIHAYQDLTEDLSLPDLEVVGMRDIQRAQWQRIYPLLSRSPIDIQIINLQDTDNLVLQTVIGEIHLGGNLDLLERQLKILPQFQKNSDQINLQNILYIDVSNPDQPFIQEKKAANTSS